MFSHGGCSSKGSEVLDRETREFIGSYDDIADSLGTFRARQSFRYMDGSNSNLYVSGYISNPDMFERAFPTA